MQPTSYAALLWRTLLLSLFIGSICILGNLLAVWLLNLTSSHATFTSQWALVMFGIFMGQLPVWPAGSRISASPIGLLGRIVLLGECTLLVVAATYASESYISSKHLKVAYDVWVGEGLYAFILVMMLVVNFSRLKAEIRVA